MSIDFWLMIMSNVWKRAKRDVYERLLADFEADVDRLVDYFDEAGDLEDDSQMVIRYEAVLLCTLNVTCSKDIFWFRMKRGVSVGESGVGNDLLYPSLDVASFPDAARTSDDEDRIRNEVSWRHLMKLKGDYCATIIVVMYKQWKFQNDLAVGRAISIPQSQVCLHSSEHFQGESPRTNCNKDPERECS